MSTLDSTHYRRRHETYEEYVAWFRRTFVGTKEMLTEAAWIGRVQSKRRDAS